MIYILEKENGTRQKIIVPDEARLMTADDEQYFQQKADEATGRRNKADAIRLLCDDINSAQSQIRRLKRLLDETDYKLNKFLEGELTEEEYEPVKAERKEWRRQINELEDAIAVKELAIQQLQEN